MARFTRVDQLEIRTAAQRNRWKQPQKPPRAKIIRHEKNRRQRQTLPGNRGIDGKGGLIEANILRRSRRAGGGGLKKLRPKIMGIVQQRIGAQPRPILGKPEFFHQQRACDRNDLLLEQEFRRNLRAERRRTVAHRRIDRVILKIREPVGGENAQVDVRMRCRKLGQSRKQPFCGKTGGNADGEMLRFGPQHRRCFRHHHRRRQRHGRGGGQTAGGGWFKVAILSSSGKGETLAKDLGGIGVTGSNQSPEDLAKLVDLTLAAWGRIDVSVNSGDHGPRAPILDISDEDWHTGMEVYLMNTIRPTRLVTPVMQKQKSGVIPNISTAYHAKNAGPKRVGVGGLPASAMFFRAYHLTRMSC